MIEPLTSTFDWPVVMLMNDPAVLLLRTKSKIAVAPVMLAPIRPMPCGTATVALAPTMMPLVFATYSEGVKPDEVVRDQLAEDLRRRAAVVDVEDRTVRLVRREHQRGALADVEAGGVRRFGVRAGQRVVRVAAPLDHGATAGGGAVEDDAGGQRREQGKVLPFQICWPTVAAAPQTGAVPMQYRPAEESVVVAGTSTAINTPMPGRAPAGGAASAVPADIASATAATKGFTEKFFATAVFIMVFLPFMLIRPKKHSPGARHWNSHPSILRSRRGGN